MNLTSNAAIATVCVFHTKPSLPLIPVQGCKLTPYEPLLKLALETDAHRPKRDRRTAKPLFEAIRQKGYTGCYAQVTEFIRRCREHTVINGKSAFVPLKFQLGEAFQFDWSEEWLKIFSPAGTLHPVIHGVVSDQSPA